MKRTATIIGFFGVFIMLVGLPTTFAGPATNVRYDTGWLPWESGPLLNPCTSELSMSLAGIYRQQYVETQDGAGGYHFAMKQIIKGTAVDEDTGYGYKLNEVWSMEFNIPTSGENQFTFPLNGRLISLDKDVPNMRYHGNVITTFDDNGTLRVDIFFYEVTCD